LMNGGQYYQSTTNTDPVKYLDPCLYENNLLTSKLSSIYGTVKYNNLASTPLKLCNLTLTGGDTYGPTTNNGVYYFSGMVDGAYSIATTCTNTWGGLTTFDVTVILKYLSSPAVFPLTDLQKKAADVNMSTTVTTFDITQLKRRLAGQPTPSWTAPNYVFEVPAVNVASGLGTSNYKGLCSGDVNGSHVPPLD
jgi:hypothetical protein